jgi:Family of unknown function (DUF6804)
MSTSVAVQEVREVWQPPISKPLDETVWQAWVAKGRAQDRRDRAARLTAAKWVSLAGLVVVAGLWSRLGPYDVAARFVVAAGAIVVMFDAIRAGHYSIAAVFAALALLYNPLAPVFSFSGDWPRAVVAASAIPFVASLTVRNLRKERNA